MIEFVAERVAASLNCAERSRGLFSVPPRHQPRPQAIVLRLRVDWHLPHEPPASQRARQEFLQGPHTGRILRENVSGRESGAKARAVSADASPTDPDLARTVATWPMLPEPIRRAVLALIEA
jgi:hypothetical protein